MQLKHSKTISVSVKDPLNSRINCISYSPNGMKLAIVSKDNFVHLFDETGERKDKFPTKASGENKVSLFCGYPMIFACTDLQCNCTGILSRFYKARRISE